MVPEVPVQPPLILQVARAVPDREMQMQKVAMEEILVAMVVAEVLAQVQELVQELPLPEQVPEAEAEADQMEVMRELQVAQEESLFITDPKRKLRLYFKKILFLQLLYQVKRRAGFKPFYLVLVIAVIRFNFFLCSILMFQYKGKLPVGRK